MANERSEHTLRLGIKATAGGPEVCHVQRELLSRGPHQRKRHFVRHKRCIRDFGLGLRHDYGDQSRWHGEGARESGMGRNGHGGSTEALVSVALVVVQQSISTIEGE